MGACDVRAALDSAVRPLCYSVGLFDFARRLHEALELEEQVN